MTKKSRTLWPCLMLVLFACNKPKQPLAVYNALHERYTKLHLNGNEKAASQYVDSLAMAIPRKNMPAGYLLAWYVSKSEVCYNTGKQDSNEIYIDSALKTIIDNRLETALRAPYANLLISKGDILFTRQDYNNAFSYYSKSIGTGVQLQDTCLLADLNYHMGMITYRQTRYIEALGYFKNTLNYNVHCSSEKYRFYRSAEVLNNIARSYMRTKTYDSAIAYCYRALSLCSTEVSRLKDRDIQSFAEKAAGLAYGYLGAIYQHSDKVAIDSAMYYYKASIALNSREGNDKASALHVSLSLAELYIRNKDTFNTGLILAKAKDLLKGIDKPELLKIWEYISYEYDKLRSAPTALQHFEEYDRLNDSLNTVNTSLQATDYAHIIQTKENEYQINLLKRDKQINHLYLLATICATVVALIFLVIIYRSYIKSRKNVTELTQLKIQLEEALASLQQSNDDKDRIMHIVAHDLRSPVGAVISMTELLLEDAPTPSQKEILQVMNKATASSLELIADILEFGNNKIAGKREIVDINALVKNAINVVKFKAEDKQQQLFTDLSSAMPKAMCYPEKLTRVVSNLVTNAIKFSEQGSEIMVKTETINEHVIISVQDNGIGIPEEDKPTLFQPFTSAKRSGTSGERSFGLGLSICKQIIEVEGGKIWFESEEGNGSIFFVELPLA